VVSRGLTKDLGVANVDERLVHFVRRSHRRLAPATRHLIMLRSRLVVGQTGRINYRIARNSRKTSLPTRERARHVYLCAEVPQAMTPSNDRNIRHVVNTKITWRLSCRWRDDPVPARAVDSISSNIARAARTSIPNRASPGKTIRSLRNVSFHDDRIELHSKVTFRLQHRGRMNVARREVPSGMEPSIDCSYKLGIWIEKQLSCYK